MSNNATQTATDENVVQTRILVSLDDGLTFIPAPSGVRLIYQNVSVPEEEELGELHVNATSEGIITDVWVTRVEHLDHNIGTSSQMIEDIAASLAEQSL